MSCAPFAYQLFEIMFFTALYIYILSSIFLARIDFNLCLTNKKNALCLNSEAGEVYSKKLANFVGKRLKSERAASVSFWDFAEFST